MRIPSSVYGKSDIASSRNERARKTDEGKSSDAGRGAQRASNEDVKVSGSAEARQLANDADVDVEKVERLRAALQSGSLKIDSRQIADRIVDSGG